MKYDWIALEREFTTHKKYAATSLREFAKKKGIPYTKNYQEKTKGWIEKRAAKQRLKDGKIQAALEAKEISREVAANERHTALWDRFLSALENGFSDPAKMLLLNGADNMARTLRNLADVMDKAQKGQRLALGMDKIGEKDAEKKLSETLDKMAEAFGNEPKGDR